MSPSPDVADSVIEVIPDCGFAAVRITPPLVKRMHSELRAQTPECVMTTFGISMNTWVKIRNGEPIRQSVGRRLAERLCSRAG